MKQFKIVPACTPFTIQWTPTTTKNTVSLLFLKGPSTNVVFQYAIAEGIAPSGSYSWTPSADLEATTTPTGYGIMIVDDVTGEYQYSTQFGISKSGCVSSSSAVVSSSSSVVAPTKAVTTSAAGYGAISTPIPSETKVSSKSSAYVVVPSASSTFVTYAPVASTGSPANGTIIYPTKSMTVPASLRPSATGNSTAPQFTGAASALQAGMGLAGFAAAVVAML